MPELPEVEVVRRSLQRSLVGDRFNAVEVRSPTLREPIPRGRLRAAARGRQVLEVRRRSKYLLIDLEGAESIVVHLGMSGRLRYFETQDPAEAHEHVVWSLDSGRELRFRDPRRFGVVLVLSTAEIPQDPHFRRLGREPLDVDLEGLIEGSDLRQLAVGRRGPVKGFLMDAHCVVGVGNIYACEALWRAGIHPRRSVARIAKGRWDALAVEVVSVLREAVLQGGTTLNDFSSAGGEPGYFAVDLQAYGREGAPCLRCGSKIRRITQSGRSTYYCPGCQR